MQQKYGILYIEAVKNRFTEGKMYGNGISETNVPECCSRSEAKYAAGEKIMLIKELGGKIGIINKGCIIISYVDSEGRNNIMEFLTEGEPFGDFFYSLLPDQEYTVTAETDCQVTYYDYFKIIDCDEAACENHPKVMRDILVMTSRKAKDLSIHLNILSQRTLRGKITAFLEYYSAEKKKKKITIPMSMSSLAEYICVDRSAMLREIANMNRDGIITSSGKEFTLNEI